MRMAHVAAVARLFFRYRVDRQRSRLRYLLGCVIAMLTTIHAPLLQAWQDGDLRRQTQEALLKASDFFVENVSSHGGYVYYVSEDLQQRWGESVATRDMAYVQPPATPTVGESLLFAYGVTGEPRLLKAAQAAGQALIEGQLKSGGWDQVIYFTPPKRGRMGDYRKRSGGKWINSSLDDDQTQSALRFLMKLDRATDFQDPAIHEAVNYGLDHLLKAQFPNGGFPQVYAGAVPRYPVRSASYPEYDWKSEGRIKNYWDYYTLNDGLAGTVADTLILARRIYGRPQYEKALLKLGDFLILSQMPDPQPAWAQQYNEHMIPMWARKFEPPAISGGESQDVMRTLIKIFQVTRDKKYLEPIPAALKYLKACRLPKGQLARFYELKSNRPLYMTSDYRLTYDDSDVPQHYGWKQTDHLDAIERDLQSALAGQEHSDSQKRSSEQWEPEVRRILAELDTRGRWVSVFKGQKLMGQPRFPKGFRFLSSEVFAANLNVLSQYLALDQ